MTKEFITMAHYPVPCHCEGGGCSACDLQTDELQFASMKEIEEFYNIHGEGMHQDPAELDLEAMIDDMINDNTDYDAEYEQDDK
jgi:hypothetical protein